MPAGMPYTGGGGWPAVGMVLGVFCVLLGAMWVGEALGYVKVSFFIGPQIAGWAGGLAIVIGVVLAIVGWKAAGPD